MATNDFETKFGILADATLSDKLPAVKNHAIGFQTLETEGENNEKAVGVSAYKVGSRLIYVPVFWLNGRVKGGDVMYLKSEDMFLPFTEVWVNFVETGKDFTTKKAIYGDKKNDKGTPYRVSTFNLGRFGSKQAGEIAKIDVEGLDKMGDYYDTPEISLKNHLALFSPKAAADLAEALISNTKLANAMFKYYTPVELTDMLTARIKEGTKTASAPTLSFVKDRKDPAVKDFTLDQKKRLWAKGIAAVDSRKEANTAHVMKKDTGRWETPTEPGWYDILMSDMSLKEGYIFKVPNPYYNNPREAKFDTVVYMDGEAIRLGSDDKLNIDQDTAIKNKELPGKEITPEVLRGVNTRHNQIGYGSEYIIDGTTAVLIEPILNGKQTETALRFYVNDRDGNRNKECSVVLTNKPGKLFVHNDVLYIPTGARIIQNVGRYPTHDEKRKLAATDFYRGHVIDSLGDSMVEAGFTLVKVASDGINYQVSSVKGTESRLTYADAFINLMAQYGLREKQASEILEDSVSKKKVADKDPVSFYVSLAYDEDLQGTDVSSTKEIISASNLDTKSVEAIIQASQEGEKEVLDTKILSEMAKSAYPLDRVKDDIPVFVKAIDKLGRVLFMFYWHNDAFEDRYGKHSIEGIEDSLRENIRSMGDLVIYLKEKTTTADEAVAKDRDPDDLSDDMV